MTYEELQKEYQKMKEENANIKNENTHIKNENTNLKIQVENQKLELNALKRYVFGSKREIIPNKEALEKGIQCSLFEDPEKQEEYAEKEIKEKVEEITVYKKRNSKKARSGIKRSALNNVEIKREEYLLEETDTCPECEGNLKPVGKKVEHVEIGYEPAKLVIKAYVKNVYKCEKCGSKEGKKETPTFVETEVPRPLLTHSFASASLATEIIYQKYYMGVPLYRQEKVWDDRGLVLPRNMMANWNIKISEYYLKSLYELMLKEIKKESSLLHCDETTMQCNKEPGRKAQSNSYMWVLCSGQEEKKEE